MPKVLRKVTWEPYATSYVMKIKLKYFKKVIGTVGTGIEIQLLSPFSPRNHQIRTYYEIQRFQTRKVTRGKKKKKKKKKHQGRVVEIVIFLEWNKFTYG